MQCPYCHSNVDPNLRICPVCHGDIEAGLRRAQEAAASSRGTQPMPRQPRGEAPYGGQQAQARPQRPANDGRSGAVPMNPSTPDHSQPVRPFDTSSMNKSPKWPIVVIVALVVVIVVAALLIAFQPWKSSTSQSATQGTTSVSQVSSDAGAGDQVAAQTEAASDVQEQPATAQAASAQDAYQVLSTAYAALAGYDERIKDVATDINNGALDGDAATRQAALDKATQVQSEIAATAGTVSSLDVTGTQYDGDTGSKAVISNLYNDLSMRVNVLVEALQKASDGQDIGDTLTRDNGSDGVNVYKADYDAVYPTAAPAAPAA